MNPSQQPPARSEKEIFFEALEKPTAAERAAYLDGACGKDLGLRARVQALLASHFCQDSFMEPAVMANGEPGGGTAVGPVTEKPGDRIGRYKLLQQIGEGGCGLVYMAEQEEPVHRRVALKVIKLGMDTKSVIARFEAERQALALMDHPNVAKVLDAGATQAGRPYFVMELVRGIKITDYCDQHNLATQARLKLFVQVCHAIQHAHQKGIIHRDIKPSNILVTLHDGVPMPKVIDFGIAKATEQKLTDKTLFTAFEQFIGTPAYTSPEQAEMSGLDIDTRSDIYSLGVLLYELLTGKTPFDAKELVAAGLEEMKRTIREKEPVRPSTRLSTMLAGDLTKVATQRQSDAPKLIHLVRGDLDWIVMTCLEKDRTRRYDTANSLALDIQRHLNDEPVVARPATAAYRLHKIVRRNRLAFAAAAVVLVALVVAAGVSSWQARVATRARNAAERARGDETRQRVIAQAAQHQADEQRQRAEDQLYAANLNLMRLAWEENNVGQVRRLLEETAAYPDRGFEWYYWQRQAHLEQMTLNGHNEWVWAAAFSPDGRSIVTGSHDGLAKVWDAKSGKELLALKGHRSWVRAVSFSPDNQRILTGSRDGTARVWEMASGKQLVIVRPGGTVGQAAFSPDGQRILTCSAGKARVWDAASGMELFTFKGRKTNVDVAAYSRDGQRIVTCSGDGTVEVWEAASGKVLLTFDGHKNRGIWSMAFSPDGQRFVSGDGDGTAQVWEAASGKFLLTLKGHRGMVYSVAFSPDSRQIITGGYDQTARIWEAGTGKELFILKGHGGGVSAASFSPDGQRILTSAGDGTAKVWTAANCEEPLTLKGHLDGIASARFSRHRAEVCSVAFSPDGQHIVSGGSDRTAKVWDLATGKELLTLRGQKDTISCAVFSPDGQRLVTGSWDGSAKVWEVATGKEIATFHRNTYPIRSAAFSPDGQRIVIARHDRVAVLWEIASGRELLTFKGHRAWVCSVAFSSDGRRIATASDDQTVKLWNAASGKELLTLTGHAAEIYSVVFSPDGQRLLSGSRDATAKVWEAATPQQVDTWQKAERAADNGRAAREREQAAAIEQERALRARDPGAIKQWLVLAPIPFEGRRGDVPLGQQQVPHEALLRPTAGERVKVGGRDQVWRAVQLEDFTLDFNLILGEMTSSSAAYAVSYIQSATNQPGLVLQVGSDDQAKIYLNGKEIYRRSEGRSYQPGQDIVSGVALKAGLNVLVFKVVNETYDWQGSVRFTDAAGQPVNGIKVGFAADLTARP